MPSKNSTVSRRKPVSRRTSSRKKKQTVSRPMPVWLRNLLAFCIIAVFSAGFYWFFIRPYAYRWKPCYGLKGYGVCMPCNYEVHGIDISHYQGIYGAQNETYIEGWEKKTSNLLIYKRLCKI